MPIPDCQRATEHHFHYEIVEDSLGDLVGYEVSCLMWDDWDRAREVVLFGATGVILLVVLLAIVATILAGQP